MGTPNNLPGFDQHVQDQLSRLSLNQAAGNQAGPSGSSSDHSEGWRPPMNQYTVHRPQRGHHYHHNHRGRGQHATAIPPPAADAFPPLGVVPSTTHPAHSQAYNTSAASSNLAASAAAQEFFGQARGRGRGNPNRQQNNRRQHVAFNDFNRQPPGPQPRQYQPAHDSRFGGYDQARSHRHRTMVQSDFLEHISRKNLTNMLSVDEIHQKQRFSERIQDLARQVVLESTPQVAESPQLRIRLQPYGSLVNSFGLAGCDVDLLLTVESSPGVYEEVSMDIKRRLEDLLLQNSIGARLLVNTRIPILQVCETPNSELLAALRERHSKSTEPERQPESSAASVKDEASVTQAAGSELAANTTDATDDHVAVAEGAEVAQPKPTSSDNTKLEFTGDCGIQCDINFSGRVALHNTRMLWNYGQCDQRVRALGYFVKNWAKARDINTPYRGTLSSYGYILMVLHYCMNVADPPLIPNLQQLAKDGIWDDSNTELFEGLDVRFEDNKQKIHQAIAANGRNNSSLGGLIRGFFSYYGTGSGFRWTDQVVSIRTPGGIITKSQKGWMKAKWSEENTNVRQRYLLAIEDPFEITHNVGRTVGHNGICAIRDEFRRAWKIIDNIQGQGENWTWSSRDGSESGIGSDLVARDTSHGDTLRKDADARKLRQMREKLEAQEAKKTATHNRSESIAESVGDNGMFGEEDDFLDTFPTDEDPSVLIHDADLQDRKVSRMRSRLPERRRYNDTTPDDESTVGFSSNEAPTDTSLSHVIGDMSEQASTQDEIQDAKSQEDLSQTQIPRATDHSLQSRELHENKGPSVQINSMTIRQGDISNVVGEIIPWTTKSKAGLWLRERDKLIREGLWKNPTTGNKGRLSATFPYDPEMTKDQLAKANAKLERHYSKTYHPIRADDSKCQIKDNPKVEIDVGSVEAGDAVHSDRHLDHTSGLENVKVGSEIAWLADTDAGRWLRWRDRKIRHNIWTGPALKWNGLARELSSLFPYDSEQTFANIERLNSELEYFFSGLDYPKRDMPLSEQRRCARNMRDAIERTLAARSDAVVSNSALTEQIGPSPTSPLQPAPEPEPELKTPDPIRTNGTTLQASYNEVEQWLQKRDQIISAGEWRKLDDEDSVFSRLNELYPYGSVTNNSDMQKEVREFFAGVLLPKRPGENAEAVLKAMLKIQHRRKSRAEDNRVKTLLNIFERNTMDSLQKARQNPVALSESKSWEEKNQLSMQAMHAITKQLPPKSSSLEESIDTLRQRRIAYYEKTQQAGGTLESAPPQVNQDNVVSSQSNHPQAVHLWDGSNVKCTDTFSRPTEPVADVSQPTRTTTTQFSPSMTASDPFEAPPRDQHNPATTDESAGEVIPKSLCPDTWRTERKHRYEDPRIMPFPRRFDFPFDQRQLLDIDIIRSGGNGCVRGSHSPYIFESDDYSWGGGGAMAQRAVSLNWSSTQGGHLCWETKSELDAKVRQQRGLLDELPCL